MPQYWNYTATVLSYVATVLKLYRDCTATALQLYLNSNGTLL